MKIIITGGAGFIGSHFVDLAVERDHTVLVLDSLTYAGDLKNLEKSIRKIDLIQGDICDSNTVNALFKVFKPDALVNFAAESHVDNSISSPGAFIETNINGTFNLLKHAGEYHKTNKYFNFLQVSTDEVYGSLNLDDPKFTEFTPYDPRSPYSASKAAADQLVKAWYHTYGLPTIITNCSNNYGPRQNPEKLIPNMITKALMLKELPVYGDGLNIRDWIHVEDHVNGILLALEKGAPGETYLIGGNAERDNLTVVNHICNILNKQAPNEHDYKDQIVFVKDRAGHDFRYAINDSKIRHSLGFKRKYNSFEDGLTQTVKWYVDKYNNT